MTDDYEGLDDRDKFGITWEEARRYMTFVASDSNPLELTIKLDTHALLRAAGLEDSE